MLYIIGLGLGDEKDITLKGLETVKKCDKVYIEAYTSLLSFGLSSNGLSSLEKLYGRSIILADREMVEEKADDILSEARESNVAFLVVGDPFGATTHSDLVVRANKLGIEVKVIHNASVMNAIGVCGLQLYRYGETVSIPFFTDTWRPDSFYEKIQRNRGLELHTLCLLDIRVKEPTLESLCRGKKQYEPARYMSIKTAIEQLLEVEQLRGESAYGEDTTCVGMARLGSDDQMIVSGSMKELLEIFTVNLTRPPGRKMTIWVQTTADMACDETTNEVVVLAVGGLSICHCSSTNGPPPSAALIAIEVLSSGVHTMGIYFPS